jgi:GNAT superfamily N-acetyltransferase
MEPEQLKEPRPDVFIREAREDDIPSLVALFAADALGGHGDTADPAALPDYLRAFRRIVASPNDALYVAELDGEVVGTFQTTLVTSMVGRGGSNLNIEAVQTRGDMRGKGIGAAMFRFAIERGREAGARLAQLTSSNARADAHRFYARMGFEHSHAGFKMKLR